MSVVAAGRDRDVVAVAEGVGAIRQGATEVALLAGVLAIGTHRMQADLPRAATGQPATETPGRNPRS